MDPQTLHVLLDRINTGRPFALVAVLKAAGSTPRKAGTRAVVGADGTVAGTIGGGRLEHDAKEAALQSIASGRPAVFDFRFGGTDAAKDSPVCGGTMRVLVDPTAAANGEVWSEAAAALRRRERGVVETTVQDGDPPRVSVRWIAGDTTPGPGGRYLSRETADGVRVETLAEPLAPPPLLLVVGGGHVGQALAHQATAVGFEVVAIEDRPEFAARGRFPDSVSVRCGTAAEELAQFEPNADTYVALVSRGHLTDAAALRSVVGKPYAYVGMMGSRRKVSLLRTQFLESGWATEEELDRVHAPIGLDIGADTVPEIAASIVAQLIAVRRGQTSGAPARSFLEQGKAALP